MNDEGEDVLKSLDLATLLNYLESCQEAGLQDTPLYADLVAELKTRGQWQGDLPDDELPLTYG